MPLLLTIEELEKHLREEVMLAGGAKKWCKRHDVFMAHALHMIENGSAAGLDSVREALGFEKVILYKARAR